MGARVEVRSAFLVVSLLLGACGGDTFSSAAGCMDGGTCPNGLVCKYGACVDGGFDGSAGIGGAGGSGATGGASGSSGSGGKGGSSAVGGSGGVGGGSGSGGTGDVGGVGGGGGTGGTDCLPGICERCRTCFELCFCQTGDGQGCVTACGTGGAGGVGGVGGTGGAGAVGGVGGFGGVGGTGGIGGSGGSGGTGGVSGWTCDPLYYGTIDGCDCGCGLFDPDCLNSNANSCEYCDNIGSCSFETCPGTIDPQDNAHCR